MRRPSTSPGQRAGSSRPTARGSGAPQLRITGTENDVNLFKSANGDTFTGTLCAKPTSQWHLPDQPIESRKIVPEELHGHVPKRLVHAQDHQQGHRDGEHDRMLGLRQRDTQLFPPVLRELNQRMHTAAQDPRPLHPAVQRTQHPQPEPLVRPARAQPDGGFNAHSAGQADMARQLRRAAVPGTVIPNRDDRSPAQVRRGHPTGLAPAPPAPHAHA